MPLSHTRRRGALGARGWGERVALCGLTDFGRYENERQKELQNELRMRRNALEFIGVFETPDRTSLLVGLGA